jgi:protein-L-isoaspartate(D-aspartate) O-methyltransferase
VDQDALRRAELVGKLKSQITDPRVLEAFGKVARERFVGATQRVSAYEDHPLPIGHGQTISQPTMIALMLQELRLRGDEKVLEIGAGSGYQTALLAELAREVIGVELIPELAEGAKEALAGLRYENARVEVAGEELGWPQEAPYDAIVVAAAAPRIPMMLVDQLAEGGRLVIPVGERDSQDLIVVEKRPEGAVIMRKGGCRFVPLIGRDAYPSTTGGNDLKK